jgi:hypothetical protein
MPRLLLTLDQKRDTLGLLDLFYECVLFLSKRVLINESGVTQDVRAQVVHRVLCDTTAGVLQPIDVIRSMLC